MKKYSLLGWRFKLTKKALSYLPLFLSVVIALIIDIVIFRIDKHLEKLPKKKGLAYFLIDNILEYKICSIPCLHFAFLIMFVIFVEEWWKRWQDNTTEELHRRNFIKGVDYLQDCIVKSFDILKKKWGV